MGKGFYANYLKRVIDIILAFFMFVVCSPILLITAILSKFKLGSPVMFKQKRIGLNEREFDILKFRTMSDPFDKYGNSISKDKRMIPYGNLLRKTSIDELPQLLNILKGEMSFIGPRPLLPEYLPYYKPKERKRHDIKPGLSGLAQINGGNTLMWEEIFDFDVHYAESCSMKMDFLILVETLFKAFKRKDVVDITSHGTDEIGSYILYRGKKLRPLNEERREQL